MPSIPKGYLQIITPLSAGTYVDGDILSAVPWRKVRQERAEGVCFRKGLVNGKRQHTRLNANGLYPLGDVAEDYLATTSQFKFERLNATQGRVTRLSDANEIMFESGVPFTQHDGKTVSMNIEPFLQRQLATLASEGGIGRPIFGVPGNEVWYGGKSDTSDAKLDTIWQSIEAKTAHTEAIECDEAVFSDYRKRLILRVDNMTDEEASALTTDEVRTRNIRIVAGSINTVPLGWSCDLLNELPPMGDRPSARVLIGELEYRIENITPDRLTVTLTGQERPVAGQHVLEASIGKRLRRVQWRNLAGIDEASVLDGATVVRRDQSIEDQRSTAVEDKPDLEG